MTERQKLTIAVAKGTADVWRAAARELGYVIDSGGPMSGEGNISELLSAVASGAVDPRMFTEALDAARGELAEDTAQTKGC